jgi:translation initiation factor IF-2
MPLKVYDLAKEYRKTNTEMQDILRELGYKGLSPSSDLDAEQVRRVRAYMAEANGSAAAPGAAVTAGARSRTSGGESAAGAGSGGGVATAPPPAARTVAPGTPMSSDVVEVPVNITIKDLADKMGVAAGEIQKVLMGMGVLAPINQRLAPDAVQRIAQKMGRTVRIAGSGAGPAVSPVPSAPAPSPTRVSATPAAPAVGVPTPPSRENGSAPAAPDVAGSPASPVVTPGRPKLSVASVAAARQATAQQVKNRPSGGLQPRPPVVTIMGHVDHGKTTLLDTIRKADVAGGEAGGITQHIGAYQIEHDGRRLTFLDTPGHAAFSAMRARGARVTDIVVIVVAADDSVMPQTEEAIKLAKEAGVPIIVAINKIDLPGANPERVMTDLTRYDIVPEAFGGDVQTVNISAKRGEGIGDLLDTILLVSDAIVDPKADPHGPAEGTVIEAKVDKGRGAVATVLVQQGTLRQGDVIVAGTVFGRIRAMTDERNGKLVKAGPSTPVELLGLNGVPEAGDRIEAAKDEKEARSIAQKREQELRDERLGQGNRLSLEALYRQLRFGATKELNVVVKGDVQGSVQAVRDSLLELGNDEVRVRVLFTGVGAVTESDVLLAASDKDAQMKNSLVVGFNVAIQPIAEKKAEQEHVQIKTFSIIYELIDAVKEAMVGLLPPIYEEANLGKAEVRALFRLPGGRSIAGCYVTDGLVRRNAKARLYRGRDLLFTGDIETLKRFKDDQREVQAGYECGLTMRDFNDVVEGDIIECFEMRQVPREL